MGVERVQNVSSVINSALNNKQASVHLNS